MKKIILVTLLSGFIYSPGQGQQTKFAKSSDGIKIAYQVSDGTKGKATNKVRRRALLLPTKCIKHGWGSV